MAQNLFCFLNNKLTKKAVCVIIVKSKNLTVYFYLTQKNCIRQISKVGSITIIYCFLSSKVQFFPNL